MARIGVFVCWCGENISRTVDCEKVAAEASKMRGVAFATDYKYMCSSPGQAKVKDAIKEHKLDRIIVAACSPRMHEKTFRSACAEAGLNPFLCEMANIREHCSWVHENKAEGTIKAIDIVRHLVYKIAHNEKLFPIKIPVTKTALVIGGGIAGIQAALDIANSGHKVVMVEKEPSIGGHMAGLSETFPTLDCSQCILTPRMVEVGNHPNIELIRYAEVEKVEGFIGNFKVTIRKKAKSVKDEICTGCGLCTTKCPVKKIPSEFDKGMGNRTAIYIPFPQAVPNKPVIDRKHCTKFKTGKCGICQKVCTIGAIDYEQQDELITRDIGAIVAATGFRALEASELYGEYGYGMYKDVINGLQFERLVSASGPTGGVLKRPSDGKEPQTIVFVQCAGSRDPSHGYPYCSKICCMYTAKHAMLYKHKVHHGKAYIFYMDIRAGGKNYDEFVRRGIEQDEAIYLRGRVSKIYQEGDKLIVKGTDTLSNKNMTIEADMVVLATTMVAQPNMDLLAQRLGISYDQYKFLSELHPKLQPVETATAGIFIAGACNAPKDIPDSVTSGMAAASKVSILFSSNELNREPIVAKVHRTAPPQYSNCVGCFYCESVCPYNAVEREEIKDKQGNVIKVIAKINEGLCQGCGTCVSACRSNCIELNGYTDNQLYSAIVGYGENSEEEDDE